MLILYSKHNRLDHWLRVLFRRTQLHDIASDLVFQLLGCLYSKLTKLSQTIVDFKRLLVMINLKFLNIVRG